MGDPDFDTPATVVDEAIAGLQQGDTHYSDVTGREELRNAIAERMNRRVGSNYTARNVSMTVGCQNALFSAAALLSEPCDEAIVFEPTYVTYTAALGANSEQFLQMLQPRLQPRKDETALTRAAETRDAAWQELDDDMQQDWKVLDLLRHHFPTQPFIGDSTQLTYAGNCTAVHRAPIADSTRPPVLAH